MHTREFERKNRKCVLSNPVLTHHETAAFQVLLNVDPTNWNLKFKHYSVQEGTTLRFYTGEGFRAHLYNQNAFGAGVDTENWVDFGAGLLSLLTVQLPSPPWAGTRSPWAAQSLLQHCSDTLGWSGSAQPSWIKAQEMGIWPGTWAREISTLTFGYWQLFLE